jgi:hypothetical protein
MRSSVRKLFNKAKNSKLEADWRSFQAEKVKYKKAIRQKQRSAWQKYVSNIVETAPVARLKKMFSKEPNQQQGCLKREDGSFATSLAENNEILLTSHFPGCVISQGCPWTALDHSSSEEAFELSSAIVDETRVAWAIKSLNSSDHQAWMGLYQPIFTGAAIFRACITLYYVPHK